MPTTAVRDAAVHFVQAGSGESILFVHGSGADHTLWGLQLRNLKSDFRVTAVDLNGHGRSPARPGEALTRYVEDVLAVMRVLEAPSVLVGHSLGGAVTLSVALEKPKRLRAIGLIGTGARLRVHPEILSTLKSDFQAAVDRILGWAFSQDPPAHLYQRARRQMLEVGQTTLLRDFEACDRFDVMDRLEEMDVPALVACGEDDRLTPPKYSEYLQHHLPGSYLRVIGGAGHMVMLERPDALSSIMRDFMSSLK